MDYKHEKKIDEFIKNRTQVVMYLTNGFQLHGTVKGYDGQTVLFQEENGTENVCWIHAVSTIQPCNRSTTSTGPVHGRR